MNVVFIVVHAGERCDPWASGLNLISMYTIAHNEPGHGKMCLMPYANNKGADQPAHPRSLISAFVVRCQDRMIPRVYISKVSRF